MEGAYRNIENHILVLVDQSDLDTAFEISGILAAKLLMPKGR